MEYGYANNYNNLVKQVWQTLTFAFNYCQKIDRGVLAKIWASRVYADLYPIISSYFLKIIIDTAVGVGNGSSTISIWGLGSIFLLWFISDALSQFLFRYQLMKVRILQRKLTARLEADLAYLHASVPIGVVENPAFRDEYTFVKREAGFRMFTIMNTAVDLVSAFIGIIVAGLVMMKFDVMYGLLMLSVMCLRFIGIDKAVKKSVTAMQTSAKYNRLWDIYEGFLESPKSSYETRILGIKSMVKKQMHDIMEKTVGLYGDTEKQLLPLRVMHAILPMSAILTIGFHALLRVLRGFMTVGDWQLLFSSSMTFLNKFRDFADSIATAKESGVYVSHVMNMYAWNKQVSDTGKAYDIAAIRLLEFRNVSFKYPHSETYALKNVSFTIQANENVAIVGVNGAGKTTLVKLLCKFYEPTEGEILINGEPITRFSKQSYWKCISALFQDFERYPMSARESIGYGNISNVHDTAGISASAKLMGMDEYFRQLPKGYDTPLIRDLDGGTDLSTGQWQKTALSRALFRPSQIIVLDEPTSNIDPHAEEQIFEKLIHVVRNRIMLLISHRFSTVKKADHILVINNGELVEEGTHKQLMKKAGMYAKLFKMQAKSYRA